MRVLITGGTGFLGRHVARVFLEAGHVVDALGKRRCDLLDGGGYLEQLCHEYRPDLVVHCAANVGGIGLNRKLPATLFRDNMKMGLEVLETAKERKAAGTPFKLIMIGTTCSYPAFAKRGEYATFVPFAERELWEGYPEPTNAAYGIAKRALITAAQAYAQEFKLDVMTLIPANLYGPGDHFFTAETNHVIPALVKKFHQAAKHGDSMVELWGDGTPTRDFLYVEDCAKAILKASNVMNSPRLESGLVVNIGTGVETRIVNVAGMLAALFEYQGKILWDDNFPNGQKRRALSTFFAEEVLDFKAETKFEVGLKKTVAWYLDEVTAHG